MPACGLLFGCGDDTNPRREVYGRVTGAEGRSGLISFVPLETTEGPAARATLVDGEYHFNRDDGPVPGGYNVLIQLEVPPDNASGVTVFKGIEIPADSAVEVPPDYETAASVPALVPDGSAKSIKVDLSLPVR